MGLLMGKVVGGFILFFFGKKRERGNEWVLIQVASFLLFDCLDDFLNWLALSWNKTLLSYFSYYYCLLTYVR